MSTDNLGYGFNDDNAVESKLMNPGIGENNTLSKIAFENSKDDGTGQDVLRFFFLDTEGFQFNHTEFPIDPERTKAFAVEYGNNPEDEVKKQFTQQANRIRHILAAFIAPEHLVLSAPSWEEYGKAVVELAADLYVGELFRLKVILNNKDFISFPKNSISPFIENMKQTQKMRINPKYDRIVPREGSPDGTNKSAADTFKSGGNTTKKKAGAAF